jgi:hypothetical protein
VPAGCTRAEAARGHHALGQCDDALVTIPTVDKVHPGKRFKPLQDKGNMRGNVVGTGMHHGDGLTRGQRSDRTAADDGGQWLDEDPTAPGE